MNFTYKGKVLIMVGSNGMDLVTEKLLVDNYIEVIIVGRNVKKQEIVR